MRRKNDRPSWLKIVLKTFAVLFFGGMWILFGIFLIVTQFEEGTDYYNSEAFYINECDEYYYERKYDELLEFMHLYDTYDDKYDVYSMSDEKNIITDVDDVNFNDYYMEVINDKNYTYFTYNGKQFYEK